VAVGSESTDARQHIKMKKTGKYCVLLHKGSAAPGKLIDEGTWSSESDAKRERFKREAELTQEQRTKGWHYTVVKEMIQDKKGFLGKSPKRRSLLK
jgi:hypothetical protein